MQKSLNLTVDSDETADTEIQTDAAEVKEDVPVENFTPPQKGDKVIVMTIKDYGEVKIRLFPEYAEKGVENFIGLAEKGYYDGLTFHRVINDFMIQGGDPKGTGHGGESLWGGTFDGGTDPHLINVSGAVAYANSGQFAGYTQSDGSQFFIVTGQKYSSDDMGELEAKGYSFTDTVKKVYEEIGGAPWLDGFYTVFGQVYDGLDVVYEIQKVKTDEGNDMPLEPVIIESVKVAEYDGEDLKYDISDYN